MNKEAKELMLAQLQRCFDHLDKSRTFLETKLTFLITQAGIVIGLILTSLNSEYHHYAVLILLAIIVYVVGVWPRKIWDVPNEELLLWILEESKNNPEEYSDEIITGKLIAYDKIDGLKIAFEKTDRLLKVKDWCIKIGLSINIIGLCLWMLDLIFGIRLFCVL